MLLLSHCLQQCSCSWHAAVHLLQLSGHCMAAVSQHGIRPLRSLQRAALLLRRLR
jgi:hypothetical protein